MLLNLVYILIGFAGLFFGGNELVKGASRLAASLGVAKVIIGLTVVAFGTSMPELLVSLQAALGGSSDIAIGNVVGSNIANIGLILGIGGLIALIPIQRGLLVRDIPIMIGVSILVFLMALDGIISQVDGLILVVGLIAFNVGMVAISLRQRNANGNGEPDQQINRLVEVGRFVVGLVVLLVGANLLVSGAVAIARELNVSELVIGITLVAIGTSLPELVTSIVAALKKHEELLMGNVVGSNIFNILGILGITALVRPIPVSTSLTTIDLPIMLGFAVVIVLFAALGRLPRWGAAILLAGYVAFIIWTVTNSTPAA